MSATQVNSKTSTKVALAYVYTAGLFALTAFFGMGGLGDYGESETSLQKLCSIVVMAYGLFAVLGVIGLISRQRWVVGAAAAWGVAVTIAAVLAPTAWAPGEVSSWQITLGALVAGAIGLTVYRVVRWLMNPARLAE
jgi:hypothetical protein